MDDKEYAFRFDAGVSSLSNTVSINDKESIATSLAMHFVLYVSKAELDELKEGMSLLGVLELLQNNMVVMRTLFTPQNCPLTASTMFDLFQIMWSSDRDAEEAVIVAWAEYLQCTEGD